MRKYPSQEDCQLLIDIMNRPYVHTGYASLEFIKLGEKVNSYPIGFKRLFDKAFGIKSPWSVRTKFYKHGISKKELYWDKEKAIDLEILGILN